MFKQFTFAIISLFILSGHATSYGMQVDKPKDFYVTVRNNYGAQIEVSYVSAGKEIIKVVNVDQNATLGLASKLSGDIKIYRAGAVKGYLVAGYTKPTQALELAWAQVKHQYADTLLLIVTSSPGRLMVQYHPTQRSTLEGMKIEKRFKGDVIDQFPGFEKYGLQKTLTPDQILAIRSWKEEVIPGGWIVGRATTGEDIARYILELPIGYNADSVKKSYNALALTWHSDKQPTEELKLQKMGTNRL